MFEIRFCCWFYDFIMRTMILRRDCIYDSKYLFDKSRILEKTIEVLDNQNLLSGNLVSIWLIWTPFENLEIQYQVITMQNKFLATALIFC